MAKTQVRDMKPAPGLSLLGLSPLCQLCILGQVTNPLCTLVPFGETGTGSSRLAMG